MIELINVSKYYPTDFGRHYVFRNVSLRLPLDKSVGVIGPNGAGKSTFLRLLGGADVPSEGTILKTGRISPPMGLTPGLQSSLTAAENARFAGRIYGMNRAEIAELIEYVRETAKIGKFFDMPIGTYSAGMRQRVAFSINMSMTFDYYLFDEVGAGGDREFRRTAKAMVQQRLKTSKFIIASHRTDELLDLCDSGIVIKDGTLTFFEDIQDALDAYNTDDDDEDDRATRRARRRAKAAATAETPNEATPATAEAAPASPRRPRRSRKAAATQPAPTQPGDTAAVDDPPAATLVAVAGAPPRQTRRRQRRAPVVAADGLASPVAEPAAENPAMPTGTAAGRQPKRRVRRSRNTPAQTGVAATAVAVTRGARRKPQGDEAIGPPPDDPQAPLDSSPTADAEATLQNPSDSAAPATDPQQRKVRRARRRQARATLAANPETPSEASSSEAAPRRRRAAARTRRNNRQQRLASAAPAATSEVATASTEPDAGEAANPGGEPPIANSRLHSHT